MFSNLGPLFKTQFRQAESNDARQHIPHEERDNQRRKKEGEKEEKPKQKWTDDTMVSVGALRSFLINFLKTMPDNENDSFLKNHELQEDVSSRPKEQNRPTNTHNAKAVRAYQTMAAHTAPEKPKENETTKNTTTDQLQSKELRDIHNLILDLEYLETKNIQNLNILKAESFIEGMKQAVLLAKSKI